MREQGKYILGTLGIAAVCAGVDVGGASTVEQYNQIPARNLFGLHEPVQAQPEIVKPQLPKIILTGITTMGSKLAFLKVQHLPRPGEQPQQGEQSYTLAEGQREDGIEILEINERTGTIRVNSAATEMTIGFDKEAGKVASAQPAPNSRPPGSPPNIAGRIRAMNPGVSGFQRMTPTRQQVPGQAEPPPPTSTPPLGQATVQQPNAPVEKPMTAEEQAILRELEQAAQPK